MVYVVGLILIGLLIIGAIKLWSVDVYHYDEYFPGAGGYYEHSYRWISVLFVIIAIAVGVALAFKFDASLEKKAKIAALDSEIEQLYVFLDNEPDNKDEIFQRIVQKLDEKDSLMN